MAEVDEDLKHLPERTRMEITVGFIARLVMGRKIRLCFPGGQINGRGEVKVLVLDEKNPAVLTDTVAGFPSDQTMTTLYMMFG